MDTKKTTILLSPELHERLTRLARQKGTSLGELVRSACKREYGGATAHPFKRRAAKFLERVAQGGVDAVIDAEILQEILHRYRAVGRWPEGRLVYDTARLIFPETLPH